MSLCRQWKVELNEPVFPVSAAGSGDGQESHQDIRTDSFHWRTRRKFWGMSLILSLIILAIIGIHSCDIPFGL